MFFKSFESNLDLLCLRSISSSSLLNLRPVFELRGRDVEVSTEIKIYLKIIKKISRSMLDLHLHVKLQINLILIRYPVKYQTKSVAIFLIKKNIHTSISLYTGLKMTILYILNMFLFLFYCLLTNTKGHVTPLVTNK